jgi:hypothetical protein
LPPAAGMVMGGASPHLVAYALDRNHLNIVVDPRTGRETADFIGYHAGQIVFAQRRSLRNFQQWHQ